MENTSPLAAPAPESPPDAPDGPGVRLFIRAVLAVARRPSRATFAAWMRVVEPAWIPRLLLVDIALNMLTGLAGLAVGHFIASSSASPVNYLVAFPLYNLIWLAVTVLGAAAPKPAGQEHVGVGESARQILRPYLLALIVVALTSLIINEPVAALQLSDVGRNPLVAILTSSISLATLIYWLVVELNALAAGSGVSRWALIIVLVLAAVVGGVVWFGLVMLLSLAGVHGVHLPL
jgi:hypothetical protein